MKWPNSVSLSDLQIDDVSKKLHAAGYNVDAKKLDPYAINIVRLAAGGDPDAEKEVQQIIESVF